MSGPVFARGTDVPVARSKAEIETLLTRYGATAYATGYNSEVAMVTFEAHGRRLQFNLPVPSKNERRFTHMKHHGETYVERPSGQPERMWEQEQRQRWRALVLVIKAKLEAVQSGVETFESAFLAQIVLPASAGGGTVGERLVPQIESIYAGGKLPKLLGMGSP